MVSFRPNSNSDNKRDAKDDKRQRVKYVWLDSDEAVFLVVGEAKESKYSYGLPIIPLYGKYRSSKDDKTYDASELRDYRVILNVPRDQDLKDLQGKRVVLVGFSENEVLIENEGGEE
ncbi:MAG: hypothetical protein JHC23_06085 [Sulfolobus sp.]|nr:hypothetical protein [Sulfolobus sp.]